MSGWMSWGEIRSVRVGKVWVRLGVFLIESDEAGK